MDVLDETVDVLVAGSGGGVAGAYTAAREGLSVALVEATDQLGGTFADPVRAGCGSLQSRTRPRGATTPSRMPCVITAMSSATAPRPSCRRPDVRGGAALIEYLERDDHFAFKVLPWPDDYSSVAGARNDGMRHIVSRAVPDNRLGRFQGLVRGPLDHERLGAPQPDLSSTGGRALVGRFLAAMADNPAVTAHLNTRLVESIVDDGRVVGGVVEREGERRAIRARRGVLLAAGGFEQNDAMRAEFGVAGTASDTMGAPGNLGLATERRWPRAQAST